MKQLQSTKEGTWIELKQVELTQEQIDLLSSTDDKATIKTLLDEIKSLREVEAQTEDLVIANAKYNEVKPTLKETDVYELISFDISNNNGILNCRINGEHKQIRF